MILTIFDGIGVTRVHAVISWRWQRAVMILTISEMLRWMTAWWRAVMILTIFNGIGVTRVHAVISRSMSIIYHGDDEEQWWHWPFDHSRNVSTCKWRALWPCILRGTIWGGRPYLSIWDQCVMWQGFMQSYIMEMGGKRWRREPNVRYDKGAYSHISWRWRRAVMIVTIWPFQATTSA